MPPKFRDLKSYCDKNGWELIGDTDHWHYEKMLQNGDVLRTKISLSVSKEIPLHTWKRILKHQLKITEEEFKDNK